ncbi:hypothetical protein Tco_1076678, partial [Tanacetum coccineum]
VENWKNPHAKIFNIRRQKEPRRPKEEIYSNSKIVQVIKTFWELGHEHKFITEIMARRANDCIVLITEPDYKNLNKNDIEDMYLLIMNNKVPDYANTGLLWSLSVFIRSTDIAKILRKRSKPDKHGHGKGKRMQKPGECYQSSTECHITDCHAGNLCVPKSNPTAEKTPPMIKRLSGQDGMERVKDSRA